MNKINVSVETVLLETLHRVLDIAIDCREKQNGVLFTVDGEEVNVKEQWDSIIGHLSDLKIDPNSKTYNDAQELFSFVEGVYEVAFGDNAINRDFTREEVLAELHEFSAKALEFDEILKGCDYGVPDCMGGDYDTLMENLEKHIEEVGWSCISVGGDPDTGEPPFAYTIGLSVTEDDFPEVMLIGLGSDKAHMVIGNLILYWKDNGLQYGKVGGVIKDLDVMVNIIDMDKTEGIDRFLPFHSFAYREKQGLSVETMDFVQVIFPTPEGEFIESEYQPFLPKKPYLREV